MKATDSNPHPDHAEVSELLPWFANASLEAAEHERVQRHLDRCEQCRSDLAALREIDDAVNDPALPRYEPPTGQLLRLQTRIAIEGGPRIVEAEEDPGWLARLGGWFTSSGSVPHWATAVQAAAIAGLALLLVVGGPGGDDMEYTTLTRPEVAAQHEGMRVQIAFAPDATEAALRETLIRIGAQLVDGPSRLGVYTIVLPAGVPNDAALGSLQESPIVTFAQPLDALLPDRGGKSLLSDPTDATEGAQP